VSRRVIALAALVDVAAILVFVAAGRRTHEEGTALASVLGVAAPFLVGLGTGWVVARAWRAPLALATGTAIWAVTVAGGLLLRRFAWDRSTAASFAIVAAVITGALFVGWRAAASTLVARRQRSAA
jgi:uncharacterized membrane protein (GlpM family)